MIEQTLEKIDGGLEAYRVSEVLRQVLEGYDFGVDAFLDDLDDAVQGGK